MTSTGADVATTLAAFPPLDLDRLRRIAADSEAKPAPALPALCMRLAHYASQLAPELDVATVAGWAASRFIDWAAALAERTKIVVHATIATDPVNLFLGLRALPDHALAQRLIDAQMQLYHDCAAAGVAPIARKNRTAMLTVFPSRCRNPAPTWLRGGLSDGQLAAELTPFACAILGIRNDKNGVKARYRLSKECLAAVAMSSVWSRDVPGVGLSLLASILLHGKPCPDGLLGWIGRLRRTDGLIGMWDLYAEAHVRANLLGTVNVYWALAAMKGGDYLGPAGA